MPGPLASGSRVQILRIAEATYGTTPATPTMITTRRTGDTIALDRKLLKSEEIRADRNLAALHLV